MATATIDTAPVLARGSAALALPAPPALGLARALTSSRLENRGVQGIVLAGSFPWNDSPLDRLLPRPLLPVAHQPLISYTLRWLRASGVRDVVVCLNPASRAARGPITEISGAAGLEFYEDAAPRGPAGCARDAALAGDAGVFVVAEGTGIPTVALADLLEAHRASGALATVAVQQEAPGEGNPCLSRPGGLYVFERRALELVSEKGFQDIKENLIPRLYRAGEHVGAHLAGARGARVLNTGTYLDANHYAVLRLLGRREPPEGYDRRGDALVHRSASVDAEARLVGPVLVGPESRVDPRATLVGPVVLGALCTVERDAVVARTVAWDRCAVGAKAVVDECVLADDAAVDPQARLAGEVRPRRRQLEPAGSAPRARARTIGPALWPRRLAR